jgi:hypothetical protein
LLLKFGEMFESAGIFCWSAIDFARKLLRQLEIAGRSSSVGVNHRE